MIYLKLVFEIGQRKVSHIGPFDSMQAAKTHQSIFGPLGADILITEFEPEPVMTPVDHIYYMSERK